MKSLPIFILTLFALPLLPAVGEPAALKLTSPWPAESKWHGLLVEAAEQTAQQTESRVNILWVSASEEADTQGGVLLGSELMEKLPLTGALMQPYRFDSPEQAQRVLTSMKPVLREHAAAENTTLIGIESMGFLTLMSRTTIQSPEALSETVVWAPAEFAEAKAVWQALGVEKIRQAPVKEVRDLLGNGDIQTVLSSPTLATLFQWHRHITHVLDLPWMQSPVGLMIESEALSELSPEDAEVVRSILSDRLTSIAESYRKHETFRRTIMARRRVAFETPTPKEKKKWRKRADKAVEEEINSGRLIREHLDLLQKHLDDSAP